jgi:hypothetical protein
VPSSMHSVSACLLLSHHWHFSLPLHTRLEIHSHQGVKGGRVSRHALCRHGVKEAACSRCIAESRTATQHPSVQAGQGGSSTATTSNSMPRILRCARGGERREVEPGAASADTSSYWPRDGGADDLGSMLSQTARHSGRSIRTLDCRGRACNLWTKIHVAGVGVAFPSLA